MQATGTLHEPQSSKGLILVVVAMLCALVLGAAGGYLAGNARPAVTSPVQAQQHAQQKVDTNPVYPNADLTRVLPTSAPADPAAGYDISQWTGSSAAQPAHGFIP